VALDGVTQEAQYGARTTLDVLDAEQELFDSEVNLARAQRDAAVSAYNLYALTGNLTPETLKLDTTSYDPKDHYFDVKHQLIGF
jgi:outer membrane protein